MTSGINTVTLNYFSLYLKKVINNANKWYKGNLKCLMSVFISNIGMAKLLIRPNFLVKLYQNPKFSEIMNRSI